MNSSTSPKRSNSKKSGRNHSPHHHHHQNQQPNDDSGRRHHHHHHRHSHNRHRHNSSSPPPTSSSGPPPSQPPRLTPYTTQPQPSPSSTTSKETICQTDARDWPVTTSISDIISVLPQFLPMGWSMYPVWNGIGFFQCSFDVMNWEANLIKSIVLSEPSTTTVSFPSDDDDDEGGAKTAATLFHVLVRTREGFIPSASSSNSNVKSNADRFLPKIVENSSWKYFCNVTDILSLLEDTSAPPPPPPTLPKTRTLAFSTAGGSQSLPPISSSTASSVTMSLSVPSTSLSSTSLRPISPVVPIMSTTRSFPSVLSTLSAAAEIAGGGAKAGTSFATASTSHNPPFLTLMPNGALPASSAAVLASGAVPIAVVSSVEKPPDARHSSKRLSFSASTSYASGVLAAGNGSVVSSVQNPNLNHVQLIPAPAAASTAVSASSSSSASPLLLSSSFSALPSTSIISTSTSAATGISSNLILHPGNSGDSQTYFSLYPVDSLGNPGSWHAPSKSLPVTSTSTTAAPSSFSSVPSRATSYHQHTSPPTVSLVEYQLPQNTSSSSSTSYSLLSTASSKASTPNSSDTKVFVASSSAGHYHIPPLPSQPVLSTSTSSSTSSASSTSSSVTMNYLGYSGALGVTHSPSLAAVGLASPPSIIHHQLPPPPPPLPPHVLPPPIVDYGTVHSAEGIGTVTSKDLAVVGNNNVASAVPTVGSLSTDSNLSSIINNSENDFYSAFQIALALGVGATDGSNHNTQSSGHFLHVPPLPSMTSQHHNVGTQLQEHHPGYHHHQQQQELVTVVESVPSEIQQQQPQQHAHMTGQAEMTYKPVLHLHSVKRDTVKYLEDPPIAEGQIEEKYRRLSSSSSSVSSSKIISTAPYKSDETAPLQQQQQQQQQQHHQISVVTSRSEDTSGRDSAHPPQLVAVSPSTLQPSSSMLHQYHQQHPDQVSQPISVEDSTPSPPLLEEEALPCKTDEDPLPHKVNAKKPCACLHCGKSFAYNSLLLKHVRRVHKDKPGDVPPQATAAVVENKTVLNEEDEKELRNYAMMQLQQQQQHNQTDSGHTQHRPASPTPSTPTQHDASQLQHQQRSLQEDPKDEAGELKLVEYRLLDDDVHEDEENVNTVVDDEPTICSKCGTQTFQGNCLKPGCSSPRPFKCPICKKGFTKKCHLTAHERIHTGERPFCCPQCVQAFSEKSKLNRHMKIHSGEKPFRCSQCLKAFTEKRSLKVHVQRLHAIGRNSNSQPLISPTTPPQVILTSTVNDSANTPFGQINFTEPPAASPVGTQSMTPPSASSSETTPVNASYMTEPSSSAAASAPTSSATSALSPGLELKSLNIVGVAGGHPVYLPGFPHGSTFAIANLPPCLPSAHHDANAAASLSSLLANANVEVVASSGAPTCSSLSTSNHHHAVSAHLVHQTGGGAVEHAIHLPPGAIQLPHSASGHPVAVINPKTLSGLMGAMQAQNLCAANAAGMKAVAAAAAAVASAAGHTTVDANTICSGSSL